MWVFAAVGVMYVFCPLLFNTNTGSMGKCLSCMRLQNLPSCCSSSSNASLKTKPDKLGAASEPEQADEISPRVVIMNNLYRCMTKPNDDGGTSVEKIASHDRKNADISDICRLSSSKAKLFAVPCYQSSKSIAINNVERTSGSFRESKLNELFNNYKSSEDDLITMEGVERLCEDLGLQPDDFKVLVLAWKFNAEHMCQFTRNEMINGCREMDVETVSQIQDKLAQLTVQLRDDPQSFKSLYRFTFKFGLDQNSGQRILPIDIALCLWKLVFALHNPPILPEWLNFVRNNEAKIRGIPRDTWNMFLNFCESVGDDLSSYNDAEAWPSIFDEFVDYEVEHKESH